MERFKNINIEKSLNRLTRPWTQYGIEPPTFSVKEVARTARVSNDYLVNSIQNNGDKFVVSIRQGNGRSKDFFLSVTDPEGNFVENIKAASKEASPYKRAVNRSKYRSRDRGGGPVIKRRIREDDLELKKTQLGKGRLKIAFQSFNKNETKEELRQAIKDRLALKWSARSSNNISPEQNILEFNVIKSQTTFLEESGLWGDSVLKSKYAFRPSPDALELNKEQRTELEEIAKLMFAKRGFLDGANKMFNSLATSSFSNSEYGKVAQKVLVKGISKEEENILISATNDKLPAICRLDLVLTEDSRTEKRRNFQIVEVEGDKTHAFGYSTITDYFRERFMQRKDTVGIVDTFKGLLTSKGIDPKDPIFLVVGNSESFYIKELEIFSMFAKKEGLNISTLPDSKIRINQGIIKNDFDSVETKTLVNIPSPDSTNKSLIFNLLSLYGEGRINTLIPPKRFLGNKGLLGLVSNGLKEANIELMLENFFDRDNLVRLREYIPETTVVTRQNKNDVFNTFSQNPAKFVIKEVMSSGMKGVALTNNRERQIDFLQRSLRNQGGYVLQSKVNQQMRDFSFSEPFGNGEIKKLPMYMRVSLFASPLGVATVSVTARETPDVHGARDAVQIPIIFS